jgi:AFG3 family protein
MIDNNSKNKKSGSNSNSNSKGNNKGNKPNPKFNIYWIYGGIAILLLALQFFSLGNTGPKEITWQEFERNMLKNGDVEKIEVINKQKAEIFIKEDRLNNARYKDVAENKGFGMSGQVAQYYFTIGSIEMFEKRLSESQDKYLKNDYIEVIY